MKYIINLRYNGNYYGREYGIRGNKYAYETSREKAKRYSTRGEALSAIRYSVKKCLNIDPKCEPIIEEVEE